jgi:hypothetical protein
VATPTWSSTSDVAPIASAATGDADSRTRPRRSGSRLSQSHRDSRSASRPSTAIRACTCHALPSDEAVCLFASANVPGRLPGREGNLDQIKHSCGQIGRSAICSGMIGYGPVSFLNGFVDTAHLTRLKLRLHKWYSQVHGRLCSSKRIP